MEISNFRCFEHLVIDDLKLINIIGGKNNAGKSAILDAILIQNVVRTADYFRFLLGIRNPNLPQMLSSNLLLNPLFYKTTNTNELSIKYEHKDLPTSTLSISKKYINAMQLPQKNLLWQLNNRIFSVLVKLDVDGSVVESFSDEFIPPDMSPANHLPTVTSYKWIFETINFYKNLMYAINIPEWLSQINLDSKKKALLISTLQNFDSDIIDIITVLENAIPIVYVKLKSERAILLNSMGDGINKALAILLYIINSPNGILLIDEIENGFHYSLYNKLLKIFCEAAFNVNCQLMMTTHNRNIIGSLLTVMDEMNKLNDLSYQRMDFYNGQRKAFYFSGEDLISSFEMNIEIR